MSENKLAEKKQVRADKPRAQEFETKMHALVRATNVRIRSVAELGALLRIVRLRMELTQGEAAECCGVGRRFYVELENGKPSVQFDKVLDVLETLGLTLSVGGPGAGFSARELAFIPVKQQEGARHAWDVDWSKLPSGPSYASGPNWARITETMIESAHGEPLNDVLTPKGPYFYRPKE